MNRRLLLLSPLLLAACQNQPPPRPAFPDLAWQHLPPLAFDAARVEVVNDYAPPLRAPNIEHEAPLPPALAAQRWAQDRLRAAGGSGRVVRAVISNGRVAEADLERTQGLRGMLTTDQSQRYQAELDMQVELRSERGFREALATASARRSITVPENATLNERDRVLYQLVEALMRDANAQLEANIRQFMAPYLR